MMRTHMVTQLNNMAVMAIDSIDTAAALYLSPSLYSPWCSLAKLSRSFMADIPTPVATNNAMQNICVHDIMTNKHKYNTYHELWL